MKRLFRISGNINNSLEHLATSIILSFLVMMFINVFIGGMGGVPAFAAILLPFYLLRSIILAENRIGHSLAMDSKAEIRHYLGTYGVGYLLVWGVMKVVSVLSKVSGWGKIGGLTLLEYVNRVYGSSMLELWAYLFAGILMFAYILLLFPLVIIRRRKHWVSYLVVVHAGMMLVCVGIACVVRFFITAPKRYWGSCVLDDLLLCENPQPWLAVIFIVFALLLALVALIFAYRYGSFVYGPRKGGRVFREEQVHSIREYRQMITVAAIVVLVVVAGSAYYFFGSRTHTPDYSQVAECLTEDSVLGPMVYQDRVYVPVGITEEWDLSENGKPLGYLGYLGQNCESRFYGLVIANILYRDSAISPDLLQMQGADYRNYLPLDVCMKEAAWKQDSLFLMWDEEWMAETGLGNATGYVTLPVTFVSELMDTYPDVACDPEQFKEYDAYFSIRGYRDMRSAFEEETDPGDWAGCILVRENKFYFCNYDCPIEGLLLQQLLDILGGNEK